MLCRKCGIFGDPIRLKWWHRMVPLARRYYCAGCGKTYLAFSASRPPSPPAATSS
jgi:hypothetical protein